MPDSSSSSAAPSTTAKRACDACHRRKVKCIGDGTRPCKNCTSAGLTCTYNAIPQKKGPKGSRAKVISELRETQRQSQLAAKRHGFDLDSPPHSPAHLRQAGLLSVKMMTTCLDYFFANLYPTQPILHRQKVGEVIGQMEQNVEAYCLVVSLCAYMMIQPNMVIPPEAFDGLEIQPQPSLQLGHTLLQEALRVRRGYNYVENPSIWSVITSFFFFGSYFCLDRQNTAWFHLREATTLAQIMGMHDESSYPTNDLIENSRRRRLYWLLFVTERAYALQQHKPLTLHATINLPTLDEDPAETVELNGFIHLVHLFRPFDDTFVGLWNKARVGCTTEWLARLQQQLTDALPQYLQCTESQAVDLRCSQQWLRTMVWQLSISHGFLSSAAADNAMSFKYPIEISRDLVHSASQFSQQSMEVHGVGLIEKLFDVACTLTDVMSVIPQDQYTFEFGPRDYLNQLMTLISTLRGGQQRYMPLLMQKINDSMPNTGYALPAIPPSLRSEEVYDGSHSSAPTSHDSTPFGSPLSAGAQPFGYGEFSVTSAIQYPRTTEAGPMSNEIDYITAESHNLAGRQTEFETGG
ncbi:uncharacterized protein MYCFIDRAFT_127068 [Pseudocercospora fijiensis CIRAD86]|uniref:Zn(2)-C6 fungal-type domain-containing protein n=1 Tax=Pseudocercospora fijiensis (strain CIRAD86) TaxID=383855 RepID=N1Q714_PSEFD|nr:uncharacterized protein MYCFIDRAFT_127068 [Pseudocercospora fijiensis CIRAD86]EME88375.1 hypothetical protein MYCFIDRAFT_127068 [Pseudocercospora fijiensis CIRAD86]